MRVVTSVCGMRIVLLVNGVFVCISGVVVLCWWCYCIMLLYWCCCIMLLYWCCCIMLLYHVAVSCCCIGVAVSCCCILLLVPCCRGIMLVTLHYLTSSLAPPTTIINSLPITPNNSISNMTCSRSTSHHSIRPFPNEPKQDQCFRFDTEFVTFPLSSPLIHYCEENSPRCPCAFARSEKTEKSSIWIWMWICL